MKVTCWGIASVYPPRSWRGKQGWDTELEASGGKQLSHAGRRRTAPARIAERLCSAKLAHAQLSGWSFANGESGLVRSHLKAL